MAGETLLADTVSQPEFDLKVPGASAPTFEGAAIFDMSLQHLLRSRSRLGGFARSFAALHFAPFIEEEAAQHSDCFPMPLPYPEVFGRRARRTGEGLALKKGVTSLLVVLNFLHSNRARAVPKTLRAGTRLTKRQWEVVRRLEHLMKGWLEVSQIGPAEMGRTAAKIETLDSMLCSLEEQARVLARSSQYSTTKNSEFVVGDPSKRLGKFSGRCGVDQMSTFKPVDPSRLKFVGQPLFNPSPYLDPLSRAVFEQPISQRLKPDDFHGRVPHVRVHCSHKERVRLFEMLDATGRLSVHDRASVSPPFGSGLFSVIKDLSRNRLILDSRAANVLEKPILRWVKSLGSGESLVRLVLDPYSKILTSGNDLKDFYYYFRSTSERSRRNFLMGSMHPKQISHLKCVREEHLRQKEVFCSLNTLAMGDSQAVEIAQTCHLGLSLQCKAITPENLTTMNRPLPRGRLVAGIVIDDLISLSIVNADHPAEIPTESAILADKMLDKYKEVKLQPNESKSFRDESTSQFWGIDLDGDSGILRGSLKRAIPLAGLLFRVATIGYATAELMQILVGSIISLFIYRRRFLSVLDSLFQSFRGRHPRDIIKLADRAVTDLLICATLLPMAAVNLKATISPILTATDASNWGEAAVQSRIPQRVADEVYRHVLRRSVWSRLLEPGKAWSRLHGALDPSTELPEGETPYVSNPLWETLSDCLQYRLLYKQQRKGNRHINVGELRGFLKAEKINGSRRPSSRHMYGLDSQVCLGCVTKGRASSVALNRELEQSIPLMLAYDSYSEFGYYRTSGNPSDDPTRGAPIREPSRKLPQWWWDLAEGDFGPFDNWMKSMGLDPDDLSGLPPFSELMEEEKEKKPFSATSDSDIPFSVHKDKTGEPAVVEQAGRSEPSFSSAGKHADVAFEVSHLVPLSSAAAALLAKIPRDQFVLPDHCSWPPTHKGFLDLFSGERGVARSVKDMAGTWVLCYDIAHDPQEDLDANAVRSDIEKMVEAGCFYGMGAAPVCASFSVAITPPSRSSLEPYGKATASDNMKAKMEVGNNSALWVCKLLRLALFLKLTVWLENPWTSWLFRLPEFCKLREDFPELGDWVVDYCRFSKPWRKRTRFLTNSCIKGHRTLCSGCARHQLLRGRSKIHRKSWTLVAQAYPAGVARAVGVGMCISSGLVQWSGRFDPASCAKAGKGGRIGEAANPGPKIDRSHFALESVPLVEAKTVALQSKTWKQFLEWVVSSLGRPAALTLTRHPALLASLVREFGNVAFKDGKSLYLYRHLVVYVQKSFVECKPYMGPCWDNISRWEMIEPVSHRAPLPTALFYAMLGVALQWRWHRFSAVLGIAFLGIARPGEVIQCLRSELILPSDMLDYGAGVGYLRIGQAKSRRRGKGAVQHLSIYDESFLSFLEGICKKILPEERIFPGSAHAFRTRWNKILRALLVPNTVRLTPGGIRGGGAIHSFQLNHDLPLLLWRMRLKHIGTLSNYLQEATGALILPSLPPESRELIRAAAAVTPFLMAFSAKGA